jgi:hypothetical protein
VRRGADGRGIVRLGSGGGAEGVLLEREIKKTPNKQDKREETMRKEGREKGVGGKRRIEVKKIHLSSGGTSARSIRERHKEGGDLYSFRENR